MNIQQFAHQLGKEDHPSRLIRALRTLSGFDPGQLRELRRDWGVWTDAAPRACAEQPEPRS